MKSVTQTPKVAIVMGSDSDYEIMRDAADILTQFEISHDVSIVSAHRTPQKMYEFAYGARQNGFGVIIAGAGGAAHLPGMLASLTELPVIGVPVPNGHLQGKDALLSIVQMPKGVPVATVAIGNSHNAGILATQMLGASNPEILDRVARYKSELRDMVLGKTLPQI